MPADLAIDIGNVPDDGYSVVKGQVRRLLSLSSPKVLLRHDFELNFRKTLSGY